MLVEVRTDLTRVERMQAIWNVAHALKGTFYLEPTMESKEATSSTDASSTDQPPAVDATAADMSADAIKASEPETPASPAPGLVLSAEEHAQSKSIAGEIDAFVHALGGDIAEKWRALRKLLGHG